MFKFVRQIFNIAFITYIIYGELVDKVVVYEGEWSEGFNSVTKRGMGTRRQRVEVYLKYIGDLEIPDTRTPEEIAAEYAAVEKAEKRLTQLRENRRRYVAGEAKKRTKNA